MTLQDDIADTRRRVGDTVRVSVATKALVIPLAAVLVLLFLWTGVVYRASAGRTAVADLPRGSCSLDRRFDPGAEHVAAPSYAVDPPSGGDHSPVPAPAGVYGSAGVPRDGELVHAMEHGYVILWYRPAAGDRVPDGVRAAYDAHQRDVLVVPRQGLGHAVVATAWHVRLLCDDVDAAQLTEFVTTFRNRGPERVAH